MEEMRKRTKEEETKCGKRVVEITVDCVNECVSVEERVRSGCGSGGEGLWS